MDKPNHTLVGLIGERRPQQTMRAYVRYIERKIDRWPLDILRELCRHYGVGVENLAIVLAARKCGRGVAHVEEQIGYDAELGRALDVKD